MLSTPSNPDLPGEVVTAEGDCDPGASATASGLPVAESAHASRIIACHDCDTLFEMPDLAVGQSVICPHCAARLQTFRPNSLHRSAALAVSAASFFFVANFFPFIELKAGGQSTRIILAQSVSALQAHGSPWLALAVAVFILGAPTISICGILYVLLPLLRGRTLPGAIHVCRWVYGSDPWNMIEVFLLGVLVSLMKLGDIATVTLGISFWGFAGLIICLTASLAAIDRHELWHRLETLRS
ncbi:MAG: paraquat-inducible protein [Chthoniobacteraceae bacterium]|nr:paraquat-inducible protein [Chthoniobacteraceae bacterium]